MINPLEPNSLVDIPLPSEKSIECEIEAKVLVGNSMHAEDYLSVHKKMRFKRFGAFKGVPLEGCVEPEGFVQFEVPERPNRIQIWAEQVFNLDTENKSFE